MNEATRLAAELRAVAKLAEGPMLKRAMTRLGVEAKEDVDEITARDFGGDRAMSGWRNGTLKLKTGFEQPTDSRLVLTPRPAGPWQVAEQGRMGGAKAPKGRRRRATMATPWGPRTFTQSNPLRIGRTKGKRTWSRGIDLVERRAAERAADIIAAEVVRGLGG